MKYKYILVSTNTDRNIEVKKFAKLKDAQKQMDEELKDFLVPHFLSEEEYEEEKAGGLRDDFCIKKRTAWVTVDSFGYMDWEIFDLKKVEKGDTYDTDSE